MVGRAGFLVRLLAAAAVLVGCAAPPADAPAAWDAIPLRGVDPLADDPDQALAAHHAAQVVAFCAAGFLDGGSPTQWFDLVVFHRAATPAGMP